MQNYNEVELSALGMGNYFNSPFLLTIPIRGYIYILYFSERGFLYEFQTNWFVVNIYTRFDELSVL
jgi:hypothetical protein